MSERPDDQPTDWRRRQRGSPRSAAGSGVPEEAPGDSGVEAPAETTGEAGEIITSRTLFSFLEPLLNVIGSFGTPVVIAGVVALVIGIGLFAFVASMRLYGIILIGVGVVLIITIGLIFLSTVFAAFISRTGKYGVNTLAMLVAFTGIVAVVNFISFANHSRIDTTATNQFSLHNSTKNLLDDLEEPVRAIAFYRDDISGQDAAEFQQLVRRAKVENTLAEFRNRNGKFFYEFKDPEVDPDLARRYGVIQYESIVVIGTKSGLTDTIQTTDQVYSQLEQDLYTGILVATGQEQRTVYFLAGHGERSPNTGGGEGYDLVRRGLEGDNYQVRTLRWDLADEDVNVPDGTTKLDGMTCIESETCPTGAALLVIAAPTAVLPEAHARALNLYLQGVKAGGTARRQGGRMIFLAEPDLPESFRDFLTGWGVIVDKGYILDLDGSLPSSPHTLRVARYNPGAPREIVIPQGSPLDVSLMPGVASLLPVLPVPDGARLALPLAVTSADSFLVDDIERTEPLAEDPRGPFVPALYVQAAGLVGSRPPESAPPENQNFGIIVFGDADFVSNSFFRRGSGASLFLNSANFLLGDFSLVSIRDRKSEFIEWNLDRNELKFVRLSSWFFVPGLMGLMAALVWWVRR